MNASQDKALYIRFMRGESMEDLARLRPGEEYTPSRMEHALARVEAAIRRHLERKEGHAR